MAKALTAILGAGAMGQLLAHQLAHQLASLDQSPVLLRRPGTATTFSAHRFHPLSGEAEHRTFRHHPADKPLSLDCLIVLTKAHQCLDALAPVMAWLPETTPVVLLHNGMGPQFEASQRWPGHPFWVGSLSDGALTLDSRTVRHTGPGQRWCGPLNQNRPATMPSSLDKLGFGYNTDPVRALWQKLTVNLVINPLTARDRVTNGTLLSPDYRAELEQLCREIAAVGQAIGYDEAPNAVMDRVLTVSEATSANRSSMLQDVDAGRPTELEAITGYLLSQANEHGLSCPAHRKLFRALV